MATQNRAPTGDGTVTGTVSGSAGSRWTLVDDYPNTSTGDMLTFGTATSAINFTYSAFSIPAGSTGISVQVRYVDGEAANGANNCGGRLVINGSNFNATTHNPAGTAGTLREDNFATNPSSGAAWTVDEINGIGTHGLDGFGINSTDSNPTFNVRSIEIQVTYTPVCDGVLSTSLSTLTLTGTGVVTAAGPSGTLSTTLSALSLTGSAQVAVSGAFSTSLSALTFTGTAAVTNTVQGALSTALSVLTLTGTATVADPPPPPEPSTVRRKPVYRFTRGSIRGSGGGRRRFN